MRKLLTAVLVLFLAVGVVGSAQNAVAVTGTVYAVSGGNLQGVVVIACLLENDMCSDARSKASAIGGDQSIAYRLDDLEAGESYLMLAWKDVNGSGEADAGDEVGVYAQGGKPVLVVPPAAGINLRMAQFSGDLDALINQAEDASSTPAPQPQQQQAPAAPAQGGLTMTGRVLPNGPSSLNGTQVFAAIFANDQLDQTRTRGVRANTDGTFTIPNLERTRYALFAWRDANGDGRLGAGDEIGAYQSAGKPVLATPPLGNVTLQLRAYSSSAFDSVRDLFLPAQPASSSGASSGVSRTTNGAVTYTIPAGWTGTGNGNFVAAFGKDDTIYRQGRLDMQVMPPRAKVGDLATQARAIWQAETKGSLDHQGQKGAAFVRRTASGLNVGVTFGTAGSFDNSANDKEFPKLSNYSVLFVVETGAQVTPIFFKLSRAETSLGYMTYEREGRPLMLAFMRTVKSAKPVTVPPLYVEKDFVGKWKQTSGTYNATNWYTPNGVYSTSTWTSTGFTLLLTFKSGGSGHYFAQLTTVNTGIANTQKEDEPLRWRIVGDQILIERPGSGRKSIYQLYGRGKDARGDPVFLTDLMYNDQKVADLDASPEDTWVVNR
jgi:uncharacterized protein (DUF2141 family)